MSSYITAHAQACVYAPLATHTHIACDSPTRSGTPLPRQVPILSNSSQRGPTVQNPGVGVTLTKHRH